MISRPERAGLVQEGERHLVQGAKREQGQEEKNEGRVVTQLSYSWDTCCRSADHRNL